MDILGLLKWPTFKIAFVLKGLKLTRSGLRLLLCPFPSPAEEFDETGEEEQSTLSRH
jgi:hypothetical protein